MSSSRPILNRTALSGSCYRSGRPPDRGRPTARIEDPPHDDPSDTGPQELAALRRRYRLERERRVRPDGAAQYRDADAGFGYYAADPYTEGPIGRDPLHDTVDVAVIGGGFGGILTGAHLRPAGCRQRPDHREGR